MKVLQRVDWSKEVTCGGCQSKILVEPSDVRVTPGSYVDGDCIPETAYANCEVCSHRIILGTSKLPKNIEDMGREAYKKDMGREAHKRERG